MDGSLSQEELDALLAGMDTEQNSNQAGTAGSDDTLSPEEIDAIGEIANICAGSSATNLSTVLNQRVNITTPEVVLKSMDELVAGTEQPCVVVKINYIEGIHGGNIQILYDKDAKVITDLMMGGDGTNLVALGDELTDMHMSALCEAMNQMTGACATSLNTMIGRKVDISPPTAAFTDLREKEAYDEIFELVEGEKFVTVRFKLEIGTLLDSSFLQIYPMEFAKNLYKLFEENNEKQEREAAQKEAEKNAPKPAPQPVAPPPQPAPAPQPAPQPVPVMQMPPQGMVQPVPGYVMPPIEEINILPAEFSMFDSGIEPLKQTEEINIIDDVSLEISVELGKTQKSVREILDFEEGTLVELNRFTGEMMDILVNGKVIAKGEIVVLEDKFAVQVKEINLEGDNNKRRNHLA